MLRPSLLFSSLLLTLVACGSGDPKEVAMQSSVDLMGKVATALEGVSSKESAEAAVGKIKALVPQIQEVMEKGKALGEPSEELVKKFEPQLDDAKKRIQEAMGKWTAYPEQMQKLMAEISKLDIG